MQMFTIPEVLSRLETGQEFAPRTITSTPSRKPVEPTPSKTVDTKVPEPSASTPEPTPTSEAKVDAVAETTGSDQPWREKMREKYGLKKKPGKV